MVRHDHRLSKPTTAMERDPIRSSLPCVQREHLGPNLFDRFQLKEAREETGEGVVAGTDGWGNFYGRSWSPDPGLSGETDWSNPFAESRLDEAAPTLSWISFDGDMYWVRLTTSHGRPRTIRVTQGDIDGAVR